MCVCVFAMIVTIESTIEHSEAVKTHSLPALPRWMVITVGRFFDGFAYLRIFLS